ncbi:hypothetical protein [Mycobacterium sp.]|uniref:hypothetical protein n=1 Tax=Mycobacterium sp. TaxID=1785 RepID=UPI00126C405F|nr:hypothetical protein [Mycobacterium sp.]KAA8969570.1 MAG: hypothetical protein F6Q13_02775 [Mycobacterium sp.]
MSLSEDNDVLANLQNAVYFAPAIRGVASGIEAVTNADQALDGALASSSGVGGAEFGLELADLRLAGAAIDSLGVVPVIWTDISVIFLEAGVMILTS